MAIVEDNLDNALLLSRAIRKSPSLELVGAFASGEEAIKKMPNVDVVLMDVKLGPGMSGIECTKIFTMTRKNLKVVMLTECADASRIFAALRAGAVGYILRGRDAAIEHDIAVAVAGGSPMTPEIAAKIVQEFRGTNQKDLTQREIEILDRLVEGYGHKDIASALNISIATVRTHLRNIFKKMRVQSSHHAVSKYLQSHRE